MNNIISPLLIAGIFLPNTSNLFGIVIQDYLFVLIFLLSFWGLKSYTAIIYFFSFSCCIIILYFFNQYGAMVLLRFFVYTFPIISISRLGAPSGWIKYVISVMLILYGLYDIAQRYFTEPNYFMIAYYLTAINHEISEDENRYGWFDEHFVVSTVLISCLFILNLRRKALWYVLTLSTTGSRMYIISAPLIMMYNTRRLTKLYFLALSGVALIASLYWLVESPPADLLLRLNNWGYHIAKLDLSSIFFGLKGTRVNDGIPIDNSFIRVLCSGGLFLLIIYFVALTVIYFRLHNDAKLLFIIFVVASIFNDIFSYPPALSAIVGGLILTSWAVSSPKRNTHLSGRKLRVDVSGSRQGRGFNEQRT